MKKLLIIATTPMQYDGLTGVLIQTIDRADRSRVELHLVPGMGFMGDYEEKMKNRGVLIHPVPDRARKLPAYMKALFLLLRREKYDVLHVHGNSATMAFEMAAGWAAGVPIRISHVHNTCSAHPFLHTALKPFLNAFVTAPAACSEAAGSWLYRKNFTVVKNGIDPLRFAFDPAMRALSRKELEAGEAFVVGHIGRFSRQKNHAFLLEIFAELLKLRPDALLLLIGEGELRESAEEKAAKLGIGKRIRFVGTTEHPEKYYAAMDVFVLPSLYEGLGIAAVEAQASGLPVILSDTVPKETAFAPGVSYLPLSETPAFWAEKIAGIPENSRREEAWQLVASAGYDIRDMGKTLAELWKLPEPDSLPSRIRLSVALAAFNGKDFIREQLESILQQTIAPDEVILCDDGSTDGTAELIAAFIEEHRPSNWKLFRRSSPLGPGANFRSALEKTRGDLVFLADQDDIWKPDKIETMAAVFFDPDIKLAVSSIRYIDRAGNEKLLGTRLSARKDHEVQIRESLAVCSYLGMSMALRREVFEKADMDLWEKTSHDWTLLLTAHALGRVVFLGKPCQYYRRHENNASGPAGQDRKQRRLFLIERQEVHIRAALHSNCLGQEEKEAARKALRMLLVRKRIVESGHPLRVLRMASLYRKMGLTFRTAAGDFLASVKGISAEK
ncbi:MAG: glycosyltransferase [Lachnospiraceae bacterium]|nr:glycosyltransferase [Lachnospiraceae bacterium]